MKRFMLLSFVSVMALFAGNDGYAQQGVISEKDVAAIEATLFATLDTLDTSDDAKFAKELEKISGDDGEAKCWFWCWRRPRWVVYPSYYYYTWYSPVYYVPFRIVTYSVPVIRTVPVVQNVPATGAASATATATVGDVTATATANVVTKFLPSSGRVSKGAVIDSKVPQNSPLFKMGLRSGDIITSVDGTPVQSMIDVRRIKADSKITYVRGNQIKVAGKPILQRTSGEVAQADTASKTADVSLDNIKSLQTTEQSLYEYYDNLEKEAAASAEMPAKEYGADEY
ncbi:MAG: PDZ domain-containing protein [Planctomycetia bacterium]|nr:PDZ domain-containing protein [Planctomycetia bacterium]